MRDTHPHGPLEGHDHTGRGSDFYCPRVFGVACESCTCPPEAPCKDAYDKTIEIEWVRRCHGRNRDSGLLQLVGGGESR